MDHLNALLRLNKEDNGILFSQVDVGNVTKKEHGHFATPAAFESAAIPPSSFMVSMP